ncbi:MAG TPA: TerC family protein [Tepidisphaeraceae bacterium]
MFWIWCGFVVFVLLLLALDLGVFHRKDHVIKTREALTWTGVWIAVALLFSIFIYFGYEHRWMGMGQQVDWIDGTHNGGWAAVVKYLTGYVIEKSLSVDNIFVMAVLFSYFAVPAMYQHRVLFWGILGAIAMRGVMIALGAQLVKYHWVIWVFGAFLIFTGLKMMFTRGEGSHDPGKNPVTRAVRKLVPVTEEYHGHLFIVRRAGRLMLTPLALALVLVETTDLVFAVDSIPAIFAITADPFLVFTSNVFAILGLRSLYFALSGMMDRFRYLKVSLAVVLIVVGVKMVTAKYLKAYLGEHFNLYLLAGVFAILGVGVVASLRKPRSTGGSPMTDRFHKQSAPATNNSTSFIR